MTWMLHLFCLSKQIVTTPPYAQCKTNWSSETWQDQTKQKTDWGSTTKQKENEIGAARSVAEPGLFVEWDNYIVKTYIKKNKFY